VKELKEIYDFFSHHPDARMWNPVKELKADGDNPCGPARPVKWNPVKELKVPSEPVRPVRMWVWNPVKELKVLRPILEVIGILVESGEGIESPA